MLCILGDIVNYVNEGVRPIIEGDRLLQSGFLILCGYLNNKILGLCLRSSTINDSPHKIEISLSAGYKNWICTCSCKAGAGGKCKHIVAVLLHLNKVDHLEQLSCTDVEQVWGKRKALKVKETVEAMPLDEFCHSKINNVTFNISQDFKNKFVEDCLQAVKNSEAALHLGDRKALCGDNLTLIRDDEPIRDEVESIKSIVDHANQSTLTKIMHEAGDMFHMKKCCVDIYNELYPCETFDVVEKTRKNFDMWKEERKFRITASRCYGLYTYCKSSHSKSDWEKKTFSYFFPKPFSNKYVSHGIEHEENARNKYRKDYDVDVFEIGLYVPRGNPWIACSPDGIVIKNKCMTKLLEIKCPFIGSTRTILECLPHLPYLKKLGEHFIINKKHPYFGQVQLEMILLNISACDFTIYSSFDNSMYVIPVPIDEEFCRDLILTLKNAFFVHMLPSLCKYYNKKEQKD